MHFTPERKTTQFYDTDKTWTLPAIMKTALPSFAESAGFAGWSRKAIKLTEKQGYKTEAVRDDDYKTYLLIYNSYL